MSANKLMNISELAEEIDISEITLNFWLKRFKKWLPYIAENGKKRYSLETLTRLLFIAERMTAQMIPSEIENNLKDTFGSGYEKNIRNKNSGGDSAEAMSQGLFDVKTVHIMESLIDTIGQSQKKIAQAHEKRAEVEERKARAIEKRAEAEEKKAQAMDNIANALQNMRHEVWPGKAGNRIAGEMAKAIALDEAELDTAGAMDDLSMLIEGDKEVNLDNSRAGTSDTSEPSDISDTDVINTSTSDIDDLSALIDTDNSGEAIVSDTADIDDISILIDISTENTMDNLTDAGADPIDDVSGADSAGDVKGTDIPLAAPLDDLSQLLDDSPPDQSLDDISQLPDNTPADKSMDNLSKLLDDSSPDQAPDDLSLLLDDDEPRQIPREYDLKPSVTLEENFDQYKSEIINHIIGLKKDGLSVEETTEQFNKAGIKTLSGKNRWSTKTIAKIYKFIESVS